MGETLGKDGCAMPQAFFGPTQLLLDVWRVKTTKVLELDALEQIPDAFLRIELRRIGRQLFEMNATGPSFAQRVFDHLTTVDGSPIPNHQQLPGNLAGQQLQKANHIGSFVRMILRLHEDPAFWSHAAHRPKMITGQLDLEHRCLANGGVRVDRHWKQIKRRLIYKDDGALFLLS